MNRVLAVAAAILVTGPFFQTQAQNQNPPDGQPVCRGAYSAIGKDFSGVSKTRKLDEWRMYAQPDGSYTVDVEMAFPAGSQARITEHLVFANGLKPAAFNLTVIPPSDKPNEPIKIHCEYGQAVLNCRTSDNGILASATLDTKMPYAFWGIAEPVIDMPWAMQAIASAAERSVDNSTAMPLITIEDGEAKDSIKLKIEETEQVKYLGPEKLEIMGKEVAADKFQMTSAGTTGGEYIWLSRSGLLLQLSSSDSGNGTIVLTTYEGPPL